MMLTEKIGAIESRMWASGTGRGLLYLHGHEQHPGGAPFLQKLSAHWSVRAPEHPGYGGGGGLEGICDIVDLVLHYRRLIENWGAGPVDVIGHSLGGMFAAEIAALCPHLVRKLVLVSPYGLWLDAEPLPDPFALSPVKLRAAKWFDPDKAPNPEPSSCGPDENFDAFRGRNLAAATKFMWPIPDRGLSRRLPFISAPTLILRGEADGLIAQSYVEAFARLIPGARWQSIPGAGHLPMIETEDRFIEIVAPFLKSDAAGTEK
jgi:pimeloyl-ACP methyl ester carboxylesterase